MEDQKNLSIAVSLVEDETHTEATAKVSIAGTDYSGSGLARRNPSDPNVPMIGEELATARALSDLSHTLVDVAARTLEDHLGRPVSIDE
ncbi:MAG: DUF1876 domain-containing protein [Actinomycetota bacterium]|nr:DUF1876 domain-containing protein [Actinomycetota bacterium]